MPAKLVREEASGRGGEAIFHDGMVARLFCDQYHVKRFVGEFDRSRAGRPWSLRCHGTMTWLAAVFRCESNSMIGYALVGKKSEDFGDEASRSVCLIGHCRGERGNGSTVN